MGRFKSKAIYGTSTIYPLSYAKHANLRYFFIEKLTRLQKHFENITRAI